MKALKLKIAGGTAALAAVIGGGAAVAATQLSPTEESDAIVQDAAKQLGVSADKLDAALKKALENRVDAAVKAGTLTAAQGAELKQRIEAGELPLIGVGHGPGGHRGHHGFVDFAAAADYLGVTEAKLRASLERRRHPRRDREGERQDRRGARGCARRRGESRSRQEGRGRPPHVGATGVDPRRARVAHRRRRQRRVRVRLPQRARRPPPSGRRPAPTPDARSPSPPAPRPTLLAAGAARDS